MDCQKLTLEACTHVAQIEQLPLHVVVQVLFFEQLQLRHMIVGTLLTAETGAALELGRQSELRHGDDDDGDEEEDAEMVEQEPVGERAVVVAVSTGQGSASATWRSAVRENQVLRLDMDSMRTRVHQLERECSTMKKAIEKIDKDSSDDGGSVGHGNGGWRGSLTRKFRCKFKTQVCDSHEPTVVDTRKGRHWHRH